MTGREQFDELLLSIENAGAPLRKKLKDLNRLRKELRESSSAGQSEVNAAIRAYLEKSDADVKKVIEGIEEATKNAVDLQGRVKEMYESSGFNDYMSDANDRTVEEIQKSPYFTSLTENKNTIDQSYSACASAEAKLDLLIKDVTLLTAAKDKLNQMAADQYVLTDASDSVNKFDIAMLELQRHATDRYNEGYAIGGTLLVVGAIFIAAALIIACPPAGPLALGLLIGGGVLAAAGALTLFGVRGVRATNPLAPVIDAMEDEEEQVLGL